MSASRGCSIREPFTNTARSRDRRSTRATRSPIRAANFVMGTGKINGRRVVVGGDDFTVRGGAADASVGNKHGYAELIAHDLRIPIIRLVDGTGGGGSVRSFETLKRTYVPRMASFDVIVNVMGMVPVIAGCMGSVAGIGAARVAASHFSVMIRGTSQLFVAGPPVVKWGTGEDLNKEELGGSEIHAHVSGAVDNEVESEDEALAQIRRYLSYFPQNVWQVPPYAKPDDNPDRREEELLSIIPRNRRQGYDTRRHAGVDSRPRFIFRDGAVFRAVADHRLRAHRRLSGRRDGERSVLHRGLARCRRVRQDGQVRRPLRHLPSAGRELRRSAGLPDWARGRDARHHSPWSARTLCGLPGADAVGRDHGAQGVRRRGRGTRQSPRR